MLQKRAVAEKTPGGLTLGEMCRFVQSSRWIFAKTMPDNPHEYTLRESAASQAAFDAFIVQIRAHGVEIVFAGSRYTCLDFAGYRFWTMGAPLDKTILINGRRLTPTEKGNDR
jgi:methyl coenzyme M reductase alpha subunit